MPPTPAQPRPLTKPRVLIGEGRDEVAFFEALLRDLNITDVQVEEYGGKSNLGKYLRELTIRPGTSSVVALGITRDADDDAGRVFQSIGTLLGNAGLTVPAAAGTIVPGTPRIGVFIFPDNVRQGMLEDLCLDAVQSDGATTCVDEFFRCVIRTTGRQSKTPAKARLHAWLSSQIDPDLRLGEAAKRAIWPWGDPAFVPVRDFLTHL